MDILAQYLSINIPMCKYYNLKIEYTSLLVLTFTVVIIIYTIEEVIDFLPTSDSMLLRELLDLTPESAQRIIETSAVITWYRFFPL